jgi:tetratricopeptide (TPR) repeat protein
MGQPSIVRLHFFKRISVKVALAILIIAGVSIYFYSSKTQNNHSAIKGPQALAIESKGVAEFNGENDTIYDFSPQDKKLAQEMMPIFNEMGNGKDVAKNKKTMAAFAKIIDKHPEYSDAYLLRATVSISAGDQDYQTILSDIDRAIKLHSSNKYKSAYNSTAGMYGLRAKVDILSGNYQQAVNDLETAIKSEPSNTNEVFNTGSPKPDEESNPTALQKKDLDLLITKYPDDYRTHVFRGLFYSFFTTFDEKYYAHANKDLKHALETNRQSALVNYLLGNIARKATFWSKAAWSDVSDLTGAKGGFRERVNEIALNYFKEAVRLDQNFVDAYAEIAASLYSLKRYTEAIPYYDKVIELQPDNAGAYNDRALAKTYIKDYYNAISDFSKAIELKKSTPSISLRLGDSYENRAAAYVKAMNYESAIEDYSRAIGLMFASQVFLMSVPQIRTLYPEFSGISDQDLLEGLRQKYFSNMSSADFVNNYQHDIINKHEEKKPYKEFVLGDLYTSRGDTYLLSGNFKNAAKDYSRGIYQGSTSILDRWRVISKTPDTEYYIDAQTLNVSPDNFSVWVKVLNIKSQNYSRQNYQIDCSGRKIKSVSATNYDSHGNLTYRSAAQDWQSVVPETIGEVLYNGMCR